MREPEKLKTLESLCDAREDQGNAQEMKSEGVLEARSREKLEALKGHCARFSSSKKDIRREILERSRGGGEELIRKVTRRLRSKSV